jgi:hypothetical protein
MLLHPPAHPPLLPQLSHHERHFASGVALLSAFKFKEVSASATFSGHLAVGTKLHIPVRCRMGLHRQSFTLFFLRF